MCHRAVPMSAVHHSAGTGASQKRFYEHVQQGDRLSEGHQRAGTWVQWESRRQKGAVRGYLVGNLEVGEALAGGLVLGAHEQVYEAARLHSPPHLAVDSRM